MDELLRETDGGRGEGRNKRRKDENQPGMNGDPTEEPPPLMGNFRRGRSSLQTVGGERKDRRRVCTDPVSERAGKHTEPSRVSTREGGWGL